MNANAIERMLETFFRRPFLYLVPLLLCAGLGVLSVASQPKLYVSTGVLSASRDTLLSNLSAVGSDSAFNFDTPATVTSERINEQLRSDEFVSSVAEASGLGTALEQGLIGLNFVRQRVGASPDGESLLKVSASTEDPVLSQRLSAATIDAFIESVIEEDLSQSATAESFYQDVADSYDTQAEAARQELNEYLLAHPEPAVGERPAEEQSQIAELTSALERVQSQYTEALAKADDARLATEQARIDITQRIRVVDEPRAPVVPLSGLRDAVMTFGLFLMLGTLLSVGAVALAAFLDRTVRTADEVPHRFGVEVLATIPAVERTSRPARRQRRPAPPPTEPVAAEASDTPDVTEAVVA